MNKLFLVSLLSLTLLTACEALSGSAGHYRNTAPTLFVPEEEEALPESDDSGFTCAVKKTCPQMISCAEAYFYLNTCGDTARDGDKDGVPCEEICE